ncbi:cytochrome P450 [Martensiomyces pterosporus]|nr:cytochrome P450 [Martensiomyces pterosporus]
MKHLASAVRRLGLIKACAISAGALAASRVVYALYFSPLRRVPGPFLARLTNKRADLVAAFGGMARYARSESERYGDIYVYGPNAVSISDPADARIVFGARSIRKAECYAALDALNIENTLSTRDPHLASTRRRQLGPYFSPSYLRRMEQTIMDYGVLALKQKWDSLISKSPAGSVEVNYSKEFLLATFDISGALSFGRAFDALKNDDATIAHWILAVLIYTGTRYMLAGCPKFIASFILLPWERKCKKFIDFSAEAIAKRKELLSNLEEKGMGSEKPADLLQAFIDAEDPESKVRMDPTQVHAESITMLMVGSETSSNTLTWTLHLLMLHPQHYQRAADEVRSAFDKDHVIHYNEGKAKLPFIESCLYESMRLWPASSCQIPRIAPEGGITLRGHFLPAGTVINVNIQGVNLNEKIWASPHLFDPTRFLGNEAAKNRVLSFASGVRACPGKALAMMEMTTILANLLKDYDFALPADYTLRGPAVLDKKGNPRVMDSRLFVVRTAKNPERDCRITVSKRI